MQFKWERTIWYCNLLLINILGLHQPTLSTLSQDQPPVLCISGHSTWDHEVIDKVPCLSQPMEMQYKAEHSLKNLEQHLTLSVCQPLDTLLIVSALAELLKWLYKARQNFRSNKLDAGLLMHTYHTSDWIGEKLTKLTLNNIDRCEHAKLVV